MVLATMPDEDNIEVGTPWGKLRASGPMVILLIALLASHIALGYLIIVENQARHAEHEMANIFHRHLNCRIELDLWVHSLKEGAPVMFVTVPRYLRECIPNFLFDNTGELERKR
jgi:hypothetical protein